MILFLNEYLMSNYHNFHLQLLNIIKKTVKILI